MTSFTVNFYFDERSFHYIKCPISYTIQEFLDKIKKIYNEKLPLNACLKGKIVPKEDKIEKYLNDLHYYAFFISNDPSKELLVNPIPINLDDYEILKKIDPRTYKAIDKKANKNVVFHFFENSDYLSNNVGRIYINSLFNSPEIPKITQYCFSIDEKARKKFKGLDAYYCNFFIVEENLNDYCHEDVREYLNSKGSNNTKINPTQRSKLIFGIASILKKMHQKQIAFINLNHDTVKLDANFEPKIFDFSMAAFAMKQNYIDIDDETHAVPNLLFFAPEMLIEDENFHNPLLSYDAYSFAIFLLQMFNSGNLALNDKIGRIRGPPNLVMRVSDGARFCRPEHVPDHYWELIQRCWDEDPSKRPTFCEIVELLKDDKYALTEFGVETNLTELHNYQERVENSDDSSNKYESLQNEIKELKKKIEKIQKKQNKTPDDSPLQILDSEMIHNLRIIREISTGGSGKVLEVGKEDKFALKVMHTGENSFDDFPGFIAEYELLKKLKHPNILEAIGFFMSDATTPPSILLELCPFDLRHCVKSKTYKTKGEIVTWIYQIAEGMKFVHKHNIVHRDLKPSNILIGKDGKIRISDFGIAKLMTSEEQSTSRGSGTQKFMAPEILKEEKYNEKADVYSFGVLLYYILSGGEMPRINIIQVGTGIKAPIPESFTKFAKDLINDCWNYDAKDRPSFDQILSLLESHNYKLIELTDLEVHEVLQFVKEHKKLIPDY